MEHDIRQDQTRGQRAADILENEVYQEAMKAIHEEVFAQWMACPARDKEGKEALWQLAKTAQKFEALFRGYVETGKLATEQLKRFEKEGLLARLRRA